MRPAAAAVEEASDGISFDLGDTAQRIAVASDEHADCGRRHRCEDELPPDELVAGDAAPGTEPTGPVQYCTWKVRHGDVNWSASLSARTDVHYSAPLKTSISSMVFAAAEVDAQPVWEYAGRLVRRTSFPHRRASAIAVDRVSVAA